MKKSPAVNPQTREGKPEVKAPPAEHELNPVKKKTALVQKAARLGWCKFRAKGRCYVEGALLEDSEQEITMSPAGSYRQRNNKNLELVEGEIPLLPEDAPERPHMQESSAVRAAFSEYEVSFIDSLEDGDPRVGAAPGGMRLIKQ